MRKCRGLEKWYIFFNEHRISRLKWDEPQITRDLVQSLFYVKYLAQCLLHTTLALPAGVTPSHLSGSSWEREMRGEFGIHGPSLSCFFTETPVAWNCLPYCRMFPTFGCHQPDPGNFPQLLCGRYTQRNTAHPHSITHVQTPPRRAALTSVDTSALRPPRVIALVE